MKQNILVIEDNEMNRVLVCDILVIAGFGVKSADTAEAGINLAREDPPDLILMDISLPGMDGLEATRILKDDQATRDIKIVALTANAMKEDERKAKEAGCIDFITKPINTRTFARHLTEILAND